MVTNFTHSPAPVVWNAGKKENPRIRMSARASRSHHGLLETGARLRTGAGMSVGVPHRKHTMALSAIVVPQFRQIMLAPYTTRRAARTMFPLGDVIPSRTTPWVTYFLLAANLLAWLLGMDGLWLASAGNVIALWVFGDNVEDRCGHGRFLVLYLACGGLAAGTQAIVTPDPLSVAIAASGAAAGVIAAYFTLFPKSLVLMGIFVGVIEVIEVPAVAIAGLWVITQLLSANVVVWACLASALAGALGVWLLKRPERQRVEWWSRTRT